MGSAPLGGPQGSPSPGQAAAPPAPRELGLPGSGSATAPRAQPIARRRRGYPRALTGSNLGAGGGGAAATAHARQRTPAPPALARPAPPGSSPPAGRILGFPRSTKVLQTASPRPAAGASGHLAGTAQTPPRAPGLQRQRAPHWERGAGGTPHLRPSEEPPEPPLCHSLLVNKGPNECAPLRQASLSALGSNVWAPDRWPLNPIAEGAGSRGAQHSPWRTSGNPLPGKGGRPFVAPLLPGGLGLRMSRAK